MTAAAALSGSGPAAIQRVLLVEDNSDDVALIERAFRKANFVAPLNVIADGEAAIQHLASGQASVSLPSLVLLDLKLPRKSGLEVLRWARSQPDLKGVPIVVLTSSEEQRDLREAYAAGANSFLTKPVDFDQLLRMVRTLGLYWLAMNKVPTKL